VHDSKSHLMTGRPLAQLCDHGLMCDFCVCSGVTQHVTELNINLQGADHLINETFDKVALFKRKL